MGTRNLTCVMLNGEYKIAQYGQWDGYPEGQGTTVLTFLKETNLNDFINTLNKIRFLTQKEYEEIISDHTNNGVITLGGKHEKYWKENLQHIDRNLGAEILEWVRDKKANKLKNSISFAGDSLFCEWCYVVDFDENTFEVYRGFNKKKITDGRFNSDDPVLEKEGDYEPVILAKIYSLHNLPSEQDFLADFVGEEE